MKVTIDSPEVNWIKRKLTREAHRLRTDAGWGGRWDDGGAGSLESDLEYWLMGLRGEVPPAFMVYIDEGKREADPEWSEFQRLRKKFKQ